MMKNWESHQNNYTEHPTLHQIQESILGGLRSKFLCERQRHQAFRRLRKPPKKQNQTKPQRSLHGFRLGNNLLHVIQGELTTEEKNIHFRMLK